MDLQHSLLSSVPCVTVVYACLSHTLNKTCLMTILNIFFCSFLEIKLEVNDGKILYKNDFQYYSRIQIIVHVSDLLYIYMILYEISYLIKSPSCFFLRQNFYMSFANPQRLTYCIPLYVLNFYFSNKSTSNDGKTSKIEFKDCLQL